MLGGRCVSILLPCTASLSTADDGSRCWPSHIAGVRHYHRCSGTVPELESGGGHAWIDPSAPSIRRKQACRPDLAMWGRHDANAPLRSCSDDADPNDPVVVAESMGYESCVTPWNAKGHRRPGATTLSHHASHVDRRYGVPLGEARDSSLRRNRSAHQFSSHQENSRFRAEAEGL